MEKQSIKNRIKEKINELEKFVQELLEIIPDNVEEYKINFEKKAACERYAEKIPEAITDLAILIIKYNNLEYPKEESESFEILEKNKIISQELSERLQDAKGMRNIIAHEYGRIEDNIVFEAVTEELERDTKEFIDKIRQLISIP